MEPYLPVYIDGALVPADQARVSVFDRGFTRGDGLFETLRAYGGRPFKLDAHLARLDQGMEVLRFPVRSADLDLKGAVEETVRASGLESARVRVQVTRGIGTTQFGSHADTPPTVVVTVQPITGPPCPPLSVIISSIRRDERSPLTRIKTVNYVPSILALMEAEEAGADDAILLNYAGNVAEGCASNVFAVSGDAVFTPDLASGVLPGIIRQTVLEIAADLGIEMHEKPIKPDFLAEADEVFLTSSSREIVPIAILNGKQVGSGGYPICELLAAEYRKRAEA